MTVLGERNAVISGIGISEVGRRVQRSGLALTVEASLRAIDDAGLSREDIDGLSTYPGFLADNPGFSPVGLPELKEALRLQLDWYSGGGETPGQFGAIFNAIAALNAGFARHVLCFRTVGEGSARTSAQRPGSAVQGRRRIASRFQWQLPFNAFSAANWIAMMAQRHMHEFGTTREQLAQIPLNCRRNAAATPYAIYQQPLTLDEYMSARIVSTPFCLYDCDVPADGSVAIVMSRADTAAGLRRPPVRIEAIGSALHSRDSWDQRPDLTTMAATDAAAMLWQRTDLTPADVSVAELYDGFSFITVAWLEALGFCKHGEGGPFIEGGHRIERSGALPLNTNGGQLSGGRLHGFSLLHEACTQLRDEAGQRQVTNAEVAVAAAGGGPLGGCILLTKS